LIQHKTKINVKAFDLMAHQINSHQIWNNRILNQQSKDPFQNVPAENWEKQLMLNHKTTLGILKIRNLDEWVNYRNMKGQEFKSTIKNSLFHVINQTTHHWGQTVMLKRNAEIDPSITDYVLSARK
jgi:uncharacterized damage-inducible protein DinB